MGRLHATFKLVWILFVQPRCKLGKAWFQEVLDVEKTTRGNTFEAWAGYIQIAETLVTSDYCFEEATGSIRCWAQWKWQQENWHSVLTGWRGITLVEFFSILIIQRKCQSSQFYILLHCLPADFGELCAKEVLNTCTSDSENHKRLGSGSFAIILVELYDLT